MGKGIRVLIKIRSDIFSSQFPKMPPATRYKIPMKWITHNDKAVWNEQLIKFAFEFFFDKNPQVHAAGTNPNRYPNSLVKI